MPTTADTQNAINDATSQNDDVKTGDTKKKSDLAPRVKSGAIYFALTFIAILCGELGVAFYLAITSIICSNELLFMDKTHERHITSDTIAVVAAAAFPIAALFGVIGIIVVVVLELIALAVSLVVDSNVRFDSMTRAFFTSCYTGMMLSGLVLVSRAVDDWWGVLFMVLLFASVWLSDAFAYLVGCAIGKHKLAPKISPKKSIEGFIAGLVASIAVWVGMSFIPGIEMNVVYAIACGTICGVFAVIGDLFESRIKRMYHVKDSGDIMPGHGGLLDRTDSLIFVSPIACALLAIVGVIPLFF